MIASKRLWNNGGKMLVWEDKCIRRETCPRAIFLIRNPTWTDLSLSTSYKVPVK